MMRKGTQRTFLSFVLAVCMLVGILPGVNVMAADSLTEQDGYYLIYTAEDLFAFKTIVNTENGTDSKNAKLMADIDLGKEAWTPLGRYSDNSSYNKGSYSGTFDGNGYVISNLYVEMSEPIETGFFGRLTGTVKNLGIVNAKIINNATIRSGIIAGDVVGGTVENVFTDGTVFTMHSQEGGISGEIANGTAVRNCYTTFSLAVANNVNGSFDNVFYVADTDNDSLAGTDVIADKAMFATGEAAYIMNEKSGSTVWYQNLDNGNAVDAWPVSSSEHGQVYKVDETICANSQETHIAYSNTNATKINATHPFVNGVCPHCSANITAQDIAIAIEKAEAELNAYVKWNKYPLTQHEEIKSIIADAKVSMESCTILEEIDEIVELTKTEIDGVKTDEDLMREQLKPVADAKIQAMRDSVDFSLYRTVQQNMINDIIDSASVDIYDATTEARIDLICASTKVLIEAVPADAVFDSAVAELEGMITEEFLALYYQGQQIELKNAVANGIVAIDASNTSEAIEVALANAKMSINSVKTAEQIDFNNAFSGAAAEGLLAYDGFIGNIGKIQGQSTGVGFANLFDYEGYSYNTLQISTEAPLTYDGLMSSSKYLTYVNGDYRSGRSFNAWGGSTFDNAGMASDGLIGVNGSGKPIYISLLMRTDGYRQNALEFTQASGFWHEGRRRFAIGSFNEEDGIASSSMDGKNYWSLRIGPDGDDDRVNDDAIIRTDKEFNAEEAVFVVLKLEFNYPGDSKISMFLNPSVEGDLPAQADAVAITKKDIRFRGMTNHANSQFSMDELRVGTSYRAVAPLAKEVEPSPTDEATPTPMVTHGPTATPSATVVPTVAATVKPSATAAASATPISTEKPNVDEPTVTPDVDITATPGGDSTPLATIKPTSEVTSVPTAEPTVTPGIGKVKKVKFAKKKVKVKVGKKATLKVKLTPAKGLTKAAKKVVWSINKKGKKVVKFVKKVKKLKGKLKVKVKAIKKGKAKVTCKAPSGKKAVCKITVK